MYPSLFQIGPFTLYSYALMVAIGFLAGSYFFIREFKRKGLDPDQAATIIAIAIVAAFAGAKIHYLIGRWDLFIADPAGTAFSDGGLTFYGAFVLATLAVYAYARIRRLRFLELADAVSPALILGYGIARLGCHFAGDGDYGFPTTLPWGTDYSRGTVPPSRALRGFPEITSQYAGGVVPDATLCHPTPVYELIVCAVFFALLWRFRARIVPTGSMFMLYLMTAGIERFAIEFMRLNPRILLGLSEAQLIAAVLIVIGAAGWYMIGRKGTTSTA